MSKIYDLPLRQVIALSASDAPTPGGGSVAALVGTLGVAMTAMVGNLTVGKTKYREVEPEVKQIIEDANLIMHRLEYLVDADIIAFEQYLAAIKLPKNTEEEIVLREEMMQKTVQGAIDVPMVTARVLLQALEITNRLAKLGNKMPISDVGVAAYVCEAALHAVLLNADINLPMVKDEDYARQVLAEKEQLSTNATALKEQALATVRERMK